MKENKFIYEFDFGGAKDWVLASNISEAKEYHLNLTQCGDHDDCEVKRVPKSKWKSMNIVNPETGNEIENFHQFAARHTHLSIPEFIASTEY